MEKIIRDLMPDAKERDEALERRQFRLEAKHWDDLSEEDKARIEHDHKNRFKERD